MATRHDQDRPRPASRVPRAAVAGLRPSWDAAQIKDRATLSCAAFAWPNVVVELAVPVPLRRRAITALAHRLDEPQAFAAALERWLAEDR